MKQIIIAAVCAFTIAFTNLSAEKLNFKVGDKSCYSIEHHIGAQYKETGQNCNADMVLDMDVELISLNEETLSFPFEVEVVLVGASGNMKAKTNLFTMDLDFSSDNGDEYLPVDQLFGRPMRFVVNSSLDLKETTGVFEALYEKYDSSRDYGLLTFITSGVEMTLLQLFHLAGEDIRVNHEYPMDSYGFFDFDDEDEEVVGVGSYKIKKMNVSEIKAVWNLDAKNIMDDVEEETSVHADVTWNRENPLQQVRKVKVDTKIVSGDDFASLDIKQKWKLR